MLERRRDVDTKASKRIEEAKKKCVQAVDQVSQTWETLLDNGKSQKIASDLTTVEATIAQMKNEIKQLALEKKKVKTTKMRTLQHQTVALRAQQQQRKEKVEELQAESKRIIGLIQPMH